MEKIISESDSNGHITKNIGSETNNESLQRPESISLIIMRHNKKNPSIMNILSLKQLYSKCLPKMAKQHILNTIIDESHMHLVMIRNRKELIGATTFKIFKIKGFIEIVFFAIKAEYQAKGYGSKLMSALKSNFLSKLDQMFKIGIEYLLTYADDLAHKFFYRQGFKKEIELDRRQFEGLIKKYKGGTLMQCCIKINMENFYLKRPQKIYQKQQKLQHFEEIEPKSTIIEENTEKSAIIEQSKSNSKNMQIKTQKSGNKKENNTGTKTIKKQKKVKKGKIQDQNSIMKWLRKAEKVKIEQTNDK